MGIFDRKATPPKTFADALMGDITFIQDESKVAEPPQLTEKAVVLESFTQFAEEQLEHVPTFEFEGGQLLKKEDPNQMPLKPRFKARSEWEAGQAQSLGGAVWAALSAGKDPSPMILFIGESLLVPAADPENVNEFLLCFPPPVAELFQKMVQAMKLAPREYVLTTLRTAESEKLTDELLEEIFWWRPRYVVPLGAQACQALLGPRERLASIHGKTFQVPRVPGPSEIMPLFHPGVIATNANMKKATWTDMQKLMKLLGKV